ncbi:MAG: four helix bundle protein [Fluviicola sp.]
MFFLNLYKKNRKMIEKKEFDIQKRTFNFALNTIITCKEINEKIITNQLIRSSTSVGSNMREATNAESKKDFLHKLAICQKECDESIYWIEILIGLKVGNEEKLLFCKDEATQILKIIRTISLKTKANLNKN